MSGSCGCCACLAGAGQPLPSFNRPGLSAIRYRAGTHATFFDAMIRRLTVPVIPAKGEYSLHALTTRERDDPSIALLDAWAITADVLTFYQERIANESYLRTATERRSLLELGRLVGYTLKPGVAASVYLAYTLEDEAKSIIPAGAKAQSIPGANEQPQMFESSEEIEARAVWNALRPRMRRPQRINVDLVRKVKQFDGDGQNRKEIDVYVLDDNVLELDSVWIEGTNTLFEKRDPLLFSFEVKFLEEPKPVYAIRRVLRTVIDTELDRTRIVLEPVRPYYLKLYLAALLALKALKNAPPDGPPPPLEAVAAKPRKSRKKASPEITEATTFDLRAHLEALLRQILLGTSRTVLQTQFANLEKLGVATEDDPAIAPQPVAGDFGALLGPLTATRARAPRNQFQFTRSLDNALNDRSDARLRLLTAFHPELATTVHPALANVTAGNQPYLQFRKLFVLRRQAAVFGYNAPDVLFPESQPHPPHPIAEPVQEDDQILHLDVADEKITVGSPLVLRNARGAAVAEVREVEAVSRSAYGISGRVSRLTLDIAWPPEKTVPTDGDNINDRLTALRHNLVQIRQTSIFAQSEELTLAQQPVDRPIGKPGDPLDTAGESETCIELDAVVDGLTAGRWIIVRGERLVEGTSGIVAAELAMIADVKQQRDVDAGGTPYSILVLAPNGIAFQYKRSSVQIFANVVPATHGETRAEILGSGSASTPMQTFTLNHTPLTFVAAPTVDGIRSTLAVRIDDALWREDSLAHAGPNDRVYAAKTSDDGKVTLTFGDGTHGQRIFSGSDNVRAIYRTGIGTGGNVRPGQIATAMTRPVGMKDVLNPIEASGGANPESAGDARKNIPVSLQAMGRVVSVSDFADFARTFAGISKATAKMLSTAGTRFVHLTIGGAGDIPIATTSDLYRNLVESLRKYGDPYQPFVVAVRAQIAITGAARVRVSADHLWSLVAPKVRAALIDTFAYDRRDFGQPVFPSEVIAAIQRVPGVAYVDLDELKEIREEDVQRPFISAPPPPSTAPPFPDGTPVVPKPTEKKPLGCDTAILPLFARKPPDEPLPLPHEFLPAEIAYLPPNLADLFILTEIEHD